ncbi:MAG TPA: radical SAM protein [Vicinamibacterales bacterium]
MASQSVLFDLGPRLPTTRDIALLVKEGGEEALTEAERRADAARYQEIQCRAALNRTVGMPFNWTLNPYRGCTHSCHYCFARKYQHQLELGAGDTFSSLILVKVNLVEVLRKELDKPSWTREQVAVGTATDPYQPIEGHYKLTRGALQALAAARTPIGLVTKGPMIVRDIDVLSELSSAAACTVYMSVPTVDEAIWRELEPGTAHPLQRLRAVQKLSEAGVRAGVLVNPLVPGFSTRRRVLARTLEAIADHKAAFAGMNTMYLEGGSRAHFMGFLAEEHPAIVNRYQRLYARKYLTKNYANLVRQRFDALRKRHRLAARHRD